MAVRQERSPQAVVIKMMSTASGIWTGDGKLLANCNQNESTHFDMHMNIVHTPVHESHIFLWQRTAAITWTRGTRVLGSFVCA